METPLLTLISLLAGLAFFVLAILRLRPRDEVWDDDDIPPFVGYTIPRIRSALPPIDDAAIEKQLTPADRIALAQLAASVEGFEFYIPSRQGNPVYNPGKEPEE